MIHCRHLVLDTSTDAKIKRNTVCQKKYLIKTTTYIFFMFYNGEKDILTFFVACQKIFLLLFE